MESIWYSNPHYISYLKEVKTKKYILARIIWISLLSEFLKLYKHSLRKDDRLKCQGKEWIESLHLFSNGNKEPLLVYKNCL
jgi:hypothetical protein